jgi:hypothetical protein
MEMDQIDDMLDALDQTRSEGEDTCFDQAAVDAWFAANGPEMLAAMRRDRAELERVRADRDEARRFHSALHDAASGGCLHTLLRHEHGCALDAINANRSSLGQMRAVNADAVQAWKDANGYDDLLTAYGTATARAEKAEAERARLVAFARDVDERFSRAMVAQGAGFNTMPVNFQEAAWSARALLRELGEDEEKPAPYREVGLDDFVSDPGGYVGESKQGPIAIIDRQGRRVAVLSAPVLGGDGVGR